jgi:hypothetical protein
MVCQAYEADIIRHRARYEHAATNVRGTTAQLISQDRNEQSICYCIDNMSN